MDKNNFQEASKYGTFPLSIFLKIKGSMSGFISNPQAVHLNLSCLRRLPLSMFPQLETLAMYIVDLLLQIVCHLAL